MPENRVDCHLYNRKNYIDNYLHSGKHYKVTSAWQTEILKNSCIDEKEKQE